MNNEQRKEFWNFIESGLDILVPQYLKNIFMFQNLDNKVTIKSINADAIKEIEEYVRSPAYKNQIQDQGNLAYYYGTYNENPEDFKFTVGDKALIYKIKEFVEKNEKKFRKRKSNVLTDNNATSENRIHNENTELTKLNNLLKSNKDSYPTDLSQFVDNIALQVNKEGNTFFANVTCPVCDKKIKVQNCNEKWIVSNFRRHFITHSCCKDKPNAKSEKKSVNSKKSKLCKVQLQTSDASSNNKYCLLPQSSTGATSSANLEANLNNEIMIQETSSNENNLHEDSTSAHSGLHYVNSLESTSTSTNFPPIDNNKSTDQFLFGISPEKEDELQNQFYYRNQPIAQPTTSNGNSSENFPIATAMKAYYNMDLDDNDDY